MIITINTKEDSVEDIKKAIKLLESYITLPKESSNATDSFAAMFGGTEQKKEEDKKDNYPGLIPY